MGSKIQILAIAVSGAVVGFVLARKMQQLVKPFWLYGFCLLGLCVLFPMMSRSLAIQYLYAPAGSDDFILTSWFAGTFIGTICTPRSVARNINTH